MRYGGIKYEVNMKEKDKINFLTLLRKHVHYVDGFWILNGTPASEDEVRDFIRQQGIPVLEKDVTDILSELSYYRYFMNVDKYFHDSIESRAKKGESKYFSSMDELYPGNKFRQIMNYYLFNEDCYCFILVGYGQTGKTTFVSLMAKIIGDAFFGRSNVALLKNSHGTAILEGKMLFEVAEAQDLDLDTANLLKSIITNDDIYINPKFQLPRTIKPHSKLIMTCNNVPRFKVTDDGIIRRFITVKMDNKIIRQNKHFIEMLDDDIPYIIYEALNNPFDIRDFAKEQYAFFENDPQWGFGCGQSENEYEGITEYDKYKSMCRALGYNPRNKMNFDKFIELAKIYKRKAERCGITLNDLQEYNGVTPFDDCEQETLNF